MMRAFASLLLAFGSIFPAHAVDVSELDDSEEVIVAPPAATAPTLALPAAAQPSCKLPAAAGLGSINKANLAAMIEDPEDLCTGRPLGAADATDVLERNDKARKADPAKQSDTLQSMLGGR